MGCTAGLAKPQSDVPIWSIPILAIHVSSPLIVNVPCWNTVGVVLGLRISYQRTPEIFVDGWTECVASKDSCVLPILRLSWLVGQ